MYCLLFWNSPNIVLAKTFVARQDLNPRSSCASTETFVISDAPHAPEGSTPRATSANEAKKIELANDKAAARKAAGPAVDAKKKRKQSGPKNRIYPKTEDVVDFADVMSEKLLQGTSMLNSLIQHNILPLQALLATTARQARLRKGGPMKSLT